MNLRLQEEEQIFQILQPTPIKASSKDLLSATLVKRGSVVHDSSQQKIAVADMSVPMLSASLRRGKVHIVGDDSDDSDSDEAGFQDTNSTDGTENNDKSVVSFSKTSEEHVQVDDAELRKELSDRIIINPRPRGLSSASRKSDEVEVNTLNTTDIMLDHYSHLSSSSQIRVDTMPVSSALSAKSAVPDDENPNVMNEHHNIRMALAEQTRELQVKTEKRYGGIITYIHGGSKILSNSQVHHLEAVSFYLEYSLYNYRKNCIRFYLPCTNVTNGNCCIGCLCMELI